MSKPIWEPVCESKNAAIFRGRHQDSDGSDEPFYLGRLYIVTDDGTRREIDKPGIGFTTEAEAMEWFEKHK